MLKQSVLAKVYAALERSPFTVADFVVEPSHKDESVVLTVRFRHKPEYVFQVQEHEGELYSLESPGQFQTSETVKVSLVELPTRLTVWARNIRDELRTELPAYKEIDELREAIEKHVAQHVEGADAPFTREEAEDLRQKLDLLSEKFAELAEHSEITRQELNRVQQELVSIKANLSTFPKGTWYKTAGTKLWSVTSKIVTSAESRQLLAQAARKLIGLSDSP